MRLYPVTIDVDRFSSEMLSWCISQGAMMRESENKKLVKFFNGKWSVVFSNGSARIHFNNENSDISLMFLLNFNDHITRHNMEGHTIDRKYNVTA